MKVWMSILRRGVAYHLFDEDSKVTYCGRYIGQHSPLVRGFIVGRVQAADEYAAHCCQRCAEAEP